MGLSTRSGEALQQRGQTAHRSAHADMVILEELDYLPFSALGRPLIFRLLSEPCERTIFATTTNPSVGELVSGFGAVKTTTSLLYRLISTDPMFHLSQKSPP